MYRSLDVISPWATGRFRDDNGADAFARQRLTPDIAETGRLGIEYMPVVFLGFSWRHGAGWATSSPLNLTPRRCGAFYQREIDNAVKAGAQIALHGHVRRNQRRHGDLQACERLEPTAGRHRLVRTGRRRLPHRSQPHMSSPSERSDARVAEGAVRDRPTGYGLSATVAIFDFRRCGSILFALQ